MKQKCFQECDRALLLNFLRKNLWNNWKVVWWGNLGKFGPYKWSNSDCLAIKHFGYFSTFEVHIFPLLSRKLLDTSHHWRTALSDSLSKKKRFRILPIQKPHHTVTKLQVHPIFMDFMRVFKALGPTTLLIDVSVKFEMNLFTKIDKHEDLAHMVYLLNRVCKMFLQIIHYFCYNFQQ